MGSHVHEQEASALFLVLQYLRDLRLNASVVTLLRESGVDPIWLCGPSREVAQLRDAVFTGQWDRVDAFLRALLTPLRSTKDHALSTQRALEAALKDVQRLQCLERFYSNTGCSLEERKTLLAQSASVLREDELQRCYANLRSTAAAPSWDVHGARLQLYERVVAVLRDEIEPDDEEHKFAVMPRRQLVALLNDALLLHRERHISTRVSDYVSLRPLSADNAVADAANESLCLDAASLSNETVRSADLTQWREQLPSRRQNPLVMSVDLRHHARAREEDSDERWQQPQQQQQRQEQKQQVTTTDTAQQTDPQALEKRQDTSTQTVGVERSDRATQHQHTERARHTISTQTEAVESSVHSTQTDAHSLPVDIGSSGSGSLEQSDPASANHSEASDRAQPQAKDTPPSTEHETPMRSTRLSAPRSYASLRPADVVRLCVVAQAREAHAVRAMALASDGSEVVVGTNGRALRVFELDRSLLEDDGAAADASTALLPLLPVALERHKHHSSPIYCAAYSSSQELIATGAAEATIKVLGRWTQREQWIRGHGGKCRALQFTGTSMLWTAASADFAVRGWDLAASDPLCVRRLEGHVGEIQAMVLGGHSDTETLLTTAAMDRTIRLWDLRTAQCASLVARFSSTDASPALALAMSPTTPLLTSGHEDGSVRLWDLRFASAARPLTMLKSHEDECRAVSWSPSGAWMLSASFDGSLRIYEQLANGELTAVASSRQHQDKVLQAQWHPTLPAIVTTGADKLVKVWGFRR
ncbi:hypothetical protein PINS_up017463 [Pythium insidiosum]|nr:hypothetical protein PINS_up017463 [Pythium insidiosum]